MIHRIVRAFLFLLFLSLSTATAQRGNSPLMWRVYGDSGTIDLIGSVHLLPSSALPLPEVMTAAFDSADVLALEITLDSNAMGSAQFKILSLAMFNGDTTLRKVLSRNTYNALKKYLKKQGMDVAMFERFRPWMVGFTIMGMKMMSGGEDDDGGSMEPGVDMIAQQRAEERGIPTRGLETIDFQLGLFTGLSLKEQEAFIMQQLREGDTESDTFEQLVGSWKRGDSAALVRSIEKEYPKNSDGYRKLIVARNDAWVPQIEAWLREPKRFVVVVGAAHLVGADGVVAQLKSRGYRVERVARQPEQ